MSDTKPDDYAALCKRLKYRAGLQMLPADTLLDEEAADAIERQSAEIARLTAMIDEAKKGLLDPSPRKETERRDEQGAAEMKMPPLPEGWLSDSWGVIYGEGHMLTYAEQCVRAALLAAIGNLNAERVDGTVSDEDAAYNSAIDHCQDAIRSLLSDESNTKP